MLPARFSESWIHSCHTVLGRKLKPHCLWHRLALEVIDSPFLAPNGRPTLSDLDVAVRICCSRYPSADDASFFRVLQLDPEKPPSVWQKMRFAAINQWFDHQAEGAKFVRYIRDFQSPPEFWQDGASAHPETRGAPPEVLSIAAQLMQSGYEESAAWMLPIGKAYWYAATFARLGGTKIIFVSESQKLFEGLQRLKDMVKSGKLRFTPEGMYWTR